MTRPIPLSVLMEMEKTAGPGFAKFASSSKFAEGIDPGKRIYPRFEASDFFDVVIEAWRAQGGKPVVAPVLPSPPMPAVPRDQWPFLAKTVLALAKAQDVVWRVTDRGVGDSVARNLAWVGAKTISHAYEIIVGKECGCANRKQALNEKFPYTKNDFS